MKALRDLLCDPSLKTLDVDGAERLALHKRILERKRMLRDVFVEFHHAFHRLAERYFEVEGLEVEIGAGIAPMRDSYPGVLATDIVATDHLDMALNAESMSLADHSVRAFYGQNCFHHFPHPERFFSELERTLVPGGGAILIEPFYGPFAAFLYKRLFKSEGFDKQFESWETPSTGPMNGANQALSYIVFVRDREAFELKYPGLEILHQEVCANYPRYLISGGLNFRQLLPDALIPVIKVVEKGLYPLRRVLGLHHIVVIRSKP
ncbi:class I SAM-dependent methyltransferase [Pseudomonas citrulli]|uniref:Methyltransferase domain-containing protein n=1 Tax=Pseudomonas citrulli TaxID=3064347 RepID=A0ABT9C0L6_9PSED|nr:methyltransferase domain-containing protein [Pseudomonas sp. K18]MDO7898341.1 methyltransferase domain-containing protein [Pseudomonas sp. K18]